jgi:hypothetical protein
MTHSMHREGTRDSLEKDYCLFIYPARGFNRNGCAPKVKRLMELVYPEHPANMIVTSLRKNLYSGIPFEEMLGSVKDNARVFCVFDTREKLKNALKRIKDADQGISIVVSGLVHRIREIAEEIGLDPHTINMSLGIHGKTELLPPPDVRQYTTMCGHGMVSPRLVREALVKVVCEKCTPWEASLLLAAPCACGIYNPSRSRELLEEMAPLYTVDRW